MPQTPWDCDICHASDALPCYCGVEDDAEEEDIWILCDLCHFSTTILGPDLPLLPGETQP